MKRMLIIVPALLMAATVVAQDGPNLTSELWSMDDATVLPTGQVDLRFTTRWVTGSDEFNRGDSDDDFIFQPSLVWGMSDNLEVFATVPIWLGDGGDAGPNETGNADTTVGFTWRFAEPDGTWPAMAFKASARIPTGDNSNGVDGEFRLIMTNDYDDGNRSHLNGFVATINNDNGDDLRDFQWGIVIGMDGPLCADGAVRWVFDYMNRSSVHDGSRNINVVDFGWEWDMAASEKLGMSVQVGLDDNDDTPNWGAAFTYSHALTH